MRKFIAVILFFTTSLEVYAAMSVKYGSFAKPATTTGNQSVSDVGFQPKIIIFFGNKLTSDSTTTSATQFFGAGINGNRQFVISDDSVDNQNNSAIDKRWSCSKCIAYLTGGTPTLLAEASFVSLDSGGFTINWTTNDAPQRIVNYLALGGDDLTNVDISTFTAPTAAGNKSVTGVGFLPDALIIADNSVTTTPTAEGNSASGAFNIGFVIGTSTQVSRSTMRQDAQGTSNVWGYQRTNSCQNALSGTGSVIRTATIVSMDSDGFTLNFNPTSTTAVYLAAISFKGGNYDAGFFDQAVGTGNQSVSGFGFQPKAVIFQSAGYAASTAVSSVSRITLGAATSSSERGTIWSGDLDGQNYSVSDQALSRSKCMIFYTEGTPSLVSDADFVSMDSDGFTINNTTQDGTARQILFFAFGDASAAPAGGGILKRNIIINNN